MDQAQGAAGVCEDMSKKLSCKEEMIIGVVRMNKATPILEVKKTANIGRLRAQFHWRSKRNLSGRFGGGWNWKIGAQAGGGTLIVEVFVFSLRFDLSKKTND